MPISRCMWWESNKDFNEEPENMKVDGFAADGIDCIIELLLHEHLHGLMCSIDGILRVMCLITGHMQDAQKRPTSRPNREV